MPLNSSNRLAHGMTGLITLSTVSLTQCYYLSLGRIIAAACDHQSCIIYAIILVMCGLHRGTTLHGQQRESQRQSFALVADRSVMESMPHLLKRVHSCQQRGYSLARDSGLLRKVKGQYVIHGEC